MSSARMTRTPDIIVTGRTTGSRFGCFAGAPARGRGARGGRASPARWIEPAGRAAGRRGWAGRRTGAARTPVVGRPERPGGTGRRGAMPAPPLVVALDDATRRGPHRPRRAAYDRRRSGP